MSTVEDPSIELPSHDPLPGTGYRAARRLGGGASSEVFEALAPDGSRCAVKVLRDLFVDAPDETSRFEREAAALAPLAHPSLAPVLDGGITAAGRPFFVMPLLEGETVKRRLAYVGVLAPRVACGIAVEILGALDVVHGAGVVHRDVKPGNVFLRTGRPAVLLDFGIAKLTGEARGRTTDARVVGTPRYLAPEQILDGAIDARTDVYAVGLLLFEMIAGRSPFDTECPMGLMRAHLEDTGHALGSLARVSRGLEHAVAKALLKSPARRWPSARAFAEVLTRVSELRTGPVRASATAGVAP